MKIRRILASCLSLLLLAAPGGKTASSGSVCAADCGSSVSSTVQEVSSAINSVPVWNSLPASSMINSSKSGIEGNDPQIIDQPNTSVKKKYDDIEVTNEWLSPLYNTDGADERYTVLFGALKKDTKQGIAVVIHKNADGSKVKEVKKCMSPKKKGPIRVHRLGAKEDSMDIIYPDGEACYFDIYNGFKLFANNSCSKVRL